MTAASGRGIFHPLSEVTRILSAMEQDDPHAAAQYLPRVYDKPRHLAAQGLAQEEAGQTREATEAYLRPTVRNGAARIRID